MGEVSAGVVPAQKAGWYVAAGLAGGLLVGALDVAEKAGSLWDRWVNPPESFVLAEHTARSEFSEGFSQRAWRRLFWARNFARRVENDAPLNDIDASWAAYNDAAADWSANAMLSIIGIEKFYGRKRADVVEFGIQTQFDTIDRALVAVRNSKALKARRNGTVPTPEDLATLRQLASTVSREADIQQRSLYVLVRGFEDPRTSRGGEEAPRDATRP